MTHTLEELKAIMDGGGTIQRGFDKIYYKDGSYFHTRKDFESPAYPYLDDIILNPSDWQEVGKLTVVPDPDFKPEIGFEKPYAPRMIVIDPRELEAMEKELKELRAEVERLRAGYLEAGFIDKLFEGMEPPTPEQEEWFKNRMP